MQKPNKEEILSNLQYEPQTGNFQRLKPTKKSLQNKQPGTINPQGYRRIKIRQKAYFAHRLAYVIMEGSWPANDIDHINGNPDDNRWSNLREATRSQNTMNSKLQTRNASGVKGVRWHIKNRNWQARITKNGKLMHVGSYKTLLEATEAIRAKRAQLHQQYANHG